jgi:osmoprotectant transport system permease protein
VINVGVAALAAYIGAGGLGEFIFGGIALNNSNMIIAGAFPAAVLAIILDRILERMQRALQDRSFRLPLLMVLVMFGFIFYAQSSTLANDHLTLAIDPEFYGRKDGYKAIQDAYGLKFNTVIMSSTLMYEALNNQEVDLIAGYATDGRIKAYNLNVLEDDGHAFPPYECVPLVNRRIIEDYPDVIQVLDKLCGMISNKVITHLNYQVDYLKKLPNEVAETFLKTSNLLATSKLPPTGKSITIGSKMFTEQYILAEVFAQLLENQTGHEIIRTPGLGGTKVCFEALRNEEIDIYPEYTGTGLQVILDTPKSVGKRVRADPDSVFNHVKEEFSGQFNIHWTCPLGFNNTYAIMGREKLMGIEVDKVSELMLNQTF